MNLTGKIIRFKADTLWGFHAAEVKQDEGGPEILVRHFDMTTEMIARERVIGYMNQGQFVANSAADF